MAATGAQRHTALLQGRCDTDYPLKNLAKTGDTHARTRTHTHTHAHTNLFLTLSMWQAKAPAGETHSILYSLTTCGCGGKEWRKGGGRRKRDGGREGGMEEKEAQVETLLLGDVAVKS